MIHESITRDNDVPHYYGNYVRMLFLATAILTFISIPFWGHLIPFGTMFEVLGGITLIALAGLISPHGRLVVWLSVFVAGFGAFLLELSAISFHTSDSTQLLLAREAGAVMLLAAFYFGVKTLRAMAQGKIGERPVPWEFEKPHKENEE